MTNTQLDGTACVRVHGRPSRSVRLCSLAGYTDWCALYICTDHLDRRRISVMGLSFATVECGVEKSVAHVFWSTRSRCRDLLVELV